MLIPRNLTSCFDVMRHLSYVRNRSSKRTLPEYHEVLRNTMIEDGKAKWEEEVTEETLDTFKKELISKHKNELRSEANKQAIAEYEDEVYQNIEKNYKEKLMREVEEGWKTRETERNTAAVK